jgi:hypothetical protein
VTRATGADRDRVVETVVAAFATDPAFRFFFPDDDTYAEHAGVFAGHLFDKRVDLGTVWIVDGGSAVAMWQPPIAVADAPALDLPDDVLASTSAPAGASPGRRRPVRCPCGCSATRAADEKPLASAAVEP